MTGLLHTARGLARGAADAARLALRRGAVVGVALLIAGLAAAFLVAAGYLGLRFLIGPGLAALATGAILLTCAAGVLAMANRMAVPQAPAWPLQTPPQIPPQTPPLARAPTPADAATMAVFTAAFLVGRHLADRRNPPDQS